MCHVAHINESCHACRGVMSHISVSHVTRVNESWDIDARTDRWAPQYTRFVKEEREGREKSRAKKERRESEKERKGERERERKTERRKSEKVTTIKRKKIWAREFLGTLYHEFMRSRSWILERHTERKRNFEIISRLKGTHQGCEKDMGSNNQERGWRGETCHLDWSVLCWLRMSVLFEIKLHCFSN